MVKLLCKTNDCVNNRNGAHAVQPDCHPRGTVVGSHQLAIEVAGVGPDTPTVTNSKGASQSDIPYHFHTGPHRALLAMAAVQKRGDDKYGPGNWRGVPIDEHLNHAMTHIHAHLVGDEQDNHLVHALCRIAYAVELDEENR